jgi:hypothetical protein
MKKIAECMKIAAAAGLFAGPASLGLIQVGCSGEVGSGFAPQAPTGTSAPNPTPTATAAATDPREAAASADYKTEREWAKQRGVNVEIGKTSVVVKRRGTSKRSMVYEDEFVVFKQDGTIVRFTGTTKPAQMPRPESSVVPDVDKDGRKDLGMTRPGSYIAHGNITYGMPDFERTAFKIKTVDGDDYLPAWRDLSGDGVFSDEEKALAVTRDYKISGIYIHYGFAETGTKLGNDKLAGPWSVGCQNIRYAELDAFVAAVGGADATFPYSIVDDK